MALERIEAALARLEAATKQPRGEASAEMARIAASNARLREAVGQSLHQIDALIARHAADRQP